MNQAPSALLLIATGCQHCPGVLHSLSELVKAGELSALEIINIANQPERAQALNVRSVPWVKIGEFELTGLRSQSELQQWIEKASSTEQQDEGLANYFEELMTSGEISKVQKIIEEQPEKMRGLLQLIADDSASLSARVGAGAVIEQLEGHDILVNNIDALGKLCQHSQARVRSDACYYLGLTHHTNAVKYIQALTNDENSEVKEIAHEALDEINT